MSPRRKRKKSHFTRVDEYSGGFTYDASGKPVFRFVTAVQWFGPKMSVDIPKALVSWYQQMAKALDMDFSDCWMALMMKSFVLTADKPITIEMVVMDADIHRADPDYPVDFSSQLRDSLNAMEDKDILASLRAEVANFDAYVEARTKWLKSVTEALTDQFNSRTTFA